MNYSETRVPIYLTIALGLIAAVVAGQFVSGLFGNPISAVAPILALGLMIWASVNYRHGLLILIGIGAFLDLCKRLLLVNGDIEYADVTKVLAIAPITAVGVFLGCLLPVLVLRRRRFVAREMLIAWISLGVFFLSTVATLVQTKSVSDAVTSAGQSGIYVFLVFIAYALFVTAPLEGFRRLIRYILIVFLPVAVYGLVQVVFGYSQLEYNYMRSGLTSTAWLLEQAHTRPFSTLNSPHAYGTMMWFCMVLALYQLSNTRSMKAMWMLIWLIFLTADMLSTTRGAAVISLMCVPAMYWFASRRKTLALYAVLIGALGLLILNAHWLLENIAWLDSFIPKTSALQQQMFNIQTFSDRLQGYVNVLGNPDVWTLLGDSSYNWSTSADSGTYNHDLLSALLLQFGVLGVIVILGSLATAAIMTHRRILSIQDIQERNLASLLGILLVFFLFANMFGKSFQVFPLNFYFFLFTGLLLALCFRSRVSNAPVVKSGETTGLQAERRRRGGQRVFAAAVTSRASLPVRSNLHLADREPRRMSGVDGAKAPRPGTETKRS